MSRMHVSVKQLWKPLLLAACVISGNIIFDLRFFGRKNVITGSLPDVGKEMSEICEDVGQSYME